MKLEYTVRPISELDGYYIETAIWLRELEQDEIEDVFSEGVTCQASDEADCEIGHLAIDRRGKILVVEVLPNHRRQGIATRMLAEPKNGRLRRQGEHARRR